MNTIIILVLGFLSWLDANVDTAVLYAVLKIAWLEIKEHHFNKKRRS